MRFYQPIELMLLESYVNTCKDYAEHSTKIDKCEPRVLRNAPKDCAEHECY
jgi:hypothetical protein